MKKLLAIICIVLQGMCLTQGYISPDLLQTFSKTSVDQPVTAMVWLKESLSQKLKTQGVIKPTATNMQSVAKQSQQSLLDILKNAKANNQITAYESFWVINAIKVTAPKSFFEEIQNRSDIYKIETNWKITLPDPVTQSTNNSSTQELQNSKTQELKTVPAATQANLTQINVDDIWTNYRVNGNQILGSGINVAVFDTGIDYNHPLLTGKITAQYDFAEKDADAFDDTSGHGTHVAGIIAASDGIGIAPSANLLIARVFDDSNNGEIAWLANASQWAINNNAKVVNMSLGDENAGANESMRSIVDSLNNMGIIVAAAIGNKGSGTGTTTSPGNCPNAIGVGAVNNNNAIASFSSRGPISWDGSSYTKPDIVAPGVSIYSTKPAWSSNYGTYDGTSQATPHIAGVIALILEANPNLGSSSVKQILKNTVDDLGDTGEDNVYGAGVINAYNAILLSDQTLPVVTHTQIARSNYDNPITITANIVDNVSLVSGTDIIGTVYFRYPSSGWGAIPLSKGANNVYSTDIQASIGASQVEYYLSVHDLNVNNVTRVPNSGTYIVALKDEEAPTISHTATNYFAINRTITINASIIDNVDSIPSAYLHYNINNATWVTTNMSLISGNLFTAAIPAVSASGTSINYYLTASDSVLNTSALPSNAPTNYFSIAEDTTPPTTSFSLYDGDTLANGIITFQAYDDIEIASVEVLIDSQALAKSTKIGLMTNSAIQINNNQISIDLSNQTPGAHTVEITIKDANNNTTVVPAFSVVINASASTVKLAINGPTNADARPINYPNPFNPDDPLVLETKIAFRTTTPANIEVAIYNQNLQRIRTLSVLYTNQAGLYYEISWDGKDEDNSVLPNGVYFYILKASSTDGSSSATTKGKMAILR